MSHRVIGKAVLAFAVTLVISLHAVVRPATAQETSDSSGGYIDDALVRSRMRVRLDAGFDMNRPDRAEFFYASWADLTIHEDAIKGTNRILNAPHNRGPLLAPQSLNYQDVSTYLELNCNERMSVFGELPFRLVQFQGNIDDDPLEAQSAPRSAQGFSDLLLGFKFAVINQPDTFLTFQFRTFIPTGNSALGLGTGHVSVENGLLLQQRLAHDLAFMGQAKLWSPIAGGSNAGNIAIFGAGLSYDLCHCNGFRITPVAEFVGWTLLNGFESIGDPNGVQVVPNTAIDSNGNPASKTHGVQDATGETIVNAKFGIRTVLGPQDDIYIGWGHALTGNRWYQDMLRIEYRRTF